MKISIVTPTYNAAEFIERTLVSVLTQAWDFELEMIVMDGGSSDGTQPILADYEERIRNGSFPIACKSATFARFSERDKWQSDAINKWLQRVTGDIVAYINGDDTYLPGAFQTVYNRLSTTNAERCYGKCRIIDREDNEIRAWITRYKNMMWKHYSYQKLLRENFISQMTVFWKRECMSRVGLFDVNEHLCMDYEYRMRLAREGDPLYMDTYIANFRFYRASKSGSRYIQQFADELRVAKTYAAGKYPWSIMVHRINYRKICVVYKILERLNM